jgi:hypothetical protein
VTPGGPALVPPQRGPAPGLPSWVLPVSLLGLAILLMSTLPALVALRRLERAERSLSEEIARMSERTERTERDRRAVMTDQYVIERSMRDLLEPGLRMGGAHAPLAAPAAPAPPR